MCIRDSYQLHIWSLPQAQAEEVAETLEGLVAEGLIRAYGWSTDDLACARLFAPKPGCTSIQMDLNVFKDADELLAICDEHDLASINRARLAAAGERRPRSARPRVGAAVQGWATGSGAARKSGCATRGSDLERADAG